jgi:DNA transposition AAA+ family ATPase
VCVDAVYLGRLRERDGGPAIEHGYAATTYQAQGATVDKAFVVADPSMDRQELYVAASRSRGETRFYATPEIQRFERDEFAPTDPYLRDGLDHIAEAAERDGAQSAAHDRALREELRQLDPRELAERMRELRSEAGAEARNESAFAAAGETISRETERLAELRSRPSVHPSNAEAARGRIEGAEAERAAMGEVTHQARAQVAAAEHLITERVRRRAPRRSSPRPAT